MIFANFYIAFLTNKGMSGKEWLLTIIFSAIFIYVSKALIIKGSYWAIAGWSMLVVGIIVLIGAIILDLSGKR